MPFSIALSWIKVLHVLFVFSWIGSLLVLTRFLAYFPKEDFHTQTRFFRIAWRTYFFVDLPSMILAVLLGIVLLVPKLEFFKEGWFHMKLTFALLLIVCDLCLGRYIVKMDREGFKRGIRFKILHALTGLLLIGVLISIYVVRNKEGEIARRLMKQSQVVKTSF